jgi:Family of unknown function (DUF6049)
LCVLAPCVLAPCVLALSGLTLTGAQASVAGGQQAGGTGPVSLAITSVSPDYARPGRPVTVSGTLTNISKNKISGLSVWLRSSSSRFDDRTLMQRYVDGKDPFADSQLYGAVTPVTTTLAPGATIAWSVTLRGSQLPMSAFGVYPLAAEADGSDGTSLAVSRTFLPFWPGQQGMDPLRQQVAWIWPLIDQPRQALGPGLLNNGLAASFGSGGRLAGLLQAGRTYASSARLTWAIDPALLANAATMSKPYHAGGSSQPASQAARAWLAQLTSATAGQQVLVTPYDDADIAALTRYHLSADLDRAYAQSRLVAGQVLGPEFSAAAGGTPGGTTAMAWPADGSASHADLVSLAASDRITTVVLDSSTMPPSPEQNFTPSAQTSAPDGTRSGMTVLLSDHTITQVIAWANSASDSKATRFSVAQRFLAETAMIAAERPQVARSIVVAPPRRWDPPAGLASDLLAETVSAPWLRPVSLAQLAAARHPAGQVRRQPPPRRVSGARLGRSLADQVRQLDQQVQLLKSIQPARAPGLDRAMFAIESSAWRGAARAGQQALAQQISADLSRQESRLKILIPPGDREQLTGKAGMVPVPIANRLGYAVRVRLRADPGGGVTVKRQPGVLTVAAGHQVIVRLPVTATGIGSTTLTLSLLSPDGTPIPGAQASMTIQATRYGSLTLVIIAAVLGAFMITSGVRTFRRRGRRAPDDAADAYPADASTGARDAAAELPDARPTPHDAAAGQPDSRDEPEKADTVVSSDRIKNGRADSGHHNTGQASGRDSAEVEEPDDYAWAPGWTDRR